MVDNQICAVLVAFRPVPEVLRAAVDAIRTQVGHTVLVDNGGLVDKGGTGIGDLGADVVQLRQESNIGLAAAQNVGIDWARRNGCSHVLILDQDSIAAPDMVEQLLRAWAELSATHRVGAVGPVFHDPREAREAPFVRIAFPMSDKLWCEAGAGTVECDFLISSGALIPLAVLDDVGAMDEGLFIDNVDMEWSFRVTSRGYRLFGVCAARMEHRLGDDRRAVLGGRYEVVRHGPVRLYFIMRNRLALYRRPYTPRVWVAQDVPRVFAKFLIFSVLVGPRPRNVRYMLRGLWDGIRGRSGPGPVGLAP